MAQIVMILIGAVVVTASIVAATRLRARGGAPVGSRPWVLAVMGAGAGGALMLIGLLGLDFD